MFNFRELEVIERVYNNNRFLKKEANMIQFKKAMYHVKEKCGVDMLNDILGVKADGNDYQVEIYDYSYPVDAHSILYKGLNKGSAKRIRDYLWNKVYNDESINVEYLDIDYVISWWSEGEYHHYQ